jgi:glutathione S-transferase
LTPVVQHGDVVLFDSAAIIRYLEANFRDRPGLLGDGRDEQWAIEELELFARAVLAAPMTELVHDRVAGGHVDDAMRERCQREFAAAAAKLAAKLGDRSWLVGEAMSLADVTAAAVVYRVRTGGLFELPTETETLSGWVDRVMSYDRHLGPAT